MCGIAGIISKSPSSETLDFTEAIHAMTAQLRNRGPNATGHIAQRGYYLGHTRLSIIDLSAEANQPMTSKSGLILVFNGEIYNYRELRESLKDFYTFKSESDSEVILAAYEKWGEACLHKFNGDWSFAIFNPKNHELFLARDWFGIKPLYYWAGEGRLAFSSEVRSLITAIPSPQLHQRHFIERLRSKQNERFDSTIIKRAVRG